MQKHISHVTGIKEGIVKNACKQGTYLSIENESEGKMLERVIDYLGGL